MNVITYAVTTLTQEAYVDMSLPKQREAQYDRMPTRVHRATARIAAKYKERVWPLARCVSGTCTGTARHVLTHEANKGLNPMKHNGPFVVIVVRSKITTRQQKGAITAPDMNVITYVGTAPAQVRIRSHESAQASKRER